MEAVPERITIKARQCKLCGQKIPADSWKNHSWGVEHIENERQLERDVLVAGFPPDTKDRILKEHFSKYGAIEHLLLDSHQEQKKCVIVHFENAGAARNVLLKRHQLGRYELDVVSRHPALLQTPFFSRDLSWTEFMLNFLLTKRSLISQLELISEELRMTEDEQKQRQVFCEKLEQKFQEFVPTCRLTLFGPSVNGLGTKGCDLDLFLDLNVPTGERMPSMDMEKICENLELVQMAPDKSGFVALMGTLGLVEVAEVFSSILQKYVPGCLNVFAQASARCPTVRFYSQGLQINCEISVTSLLALQNTSLIRFYAMLDERFQLLYFALHYWMTYHNLGNSKKGRLSKYALSMLVAFFLQSCDSPILLTVEELQKLEPGADVQMLADGWEVPFCTDVTKVQRQANNTNRGRLLADFFQFYDDLDLEDSVLCLRTGEIKSKAEFRTEIEEHKDSSKFAKFKMGHLTIQDPFELNRNVAANVTEDTFRELLDAVNEASLCTSGQSYWRSLEPGHIWGFPYLLCGNPGRSVLADPSEVQVSTGETLSSFDVTIGFEAGECCNYVSSNPRRNREHAASCSRKICTVVRDVLTRGYKFQLQDLKEDDESNGDEDFSRWVRTRFSRGRGRARGKWRRLDVSDVDASPNQKLDEYLIQICYPVWWKRDEARELLGECYLHPIYVEEAVSEIVETLHRTFSSDVPVCECLCTLWPLEKPRDAGVRLTVEPLHLPGRSDLRKAFQEFFENDVPDLVRQLVSEDISNIAIVEVK